MAERKKGKKRKEEYVPPGEEVVEKPSKEEYNIAKWMRNNVPIKKTKFLNHNVEYFTAIKAVDGLLNSKWAKGNDALFKTREDIVDYLHIMLEHKFFHRAKKVPVSEQELKGKKKDKKNVESSSDERKKEKVDKEKEKEKGTDAENSVAEGKPEGSSEKEKRKRKIRLDMHNDQRFVDGLDAYVWIYEPIPFHYWLFGALLVLGAIGICLFPLWPPSVRLGVYYLSVAAAGFLVFIILLAVLRLILFCIVWILTLGRHHIWILPNLTEDVGFLASFWPLYTYEYKGGDSKSINKKSDKKKKKDKDSDAEEESNKKDDVKSEKEPTSIEASADLKDHGESNNEEAGGGVETVNASESESESSSQRSSTGKDFELLDQEELYS